MVAPVPRGRFNRAACHVDAYDLRILRNQIALRPLQEEIGVFDWLGIVERRAEDVRESEVAAYVAIFVGCRSQVRRDQNPTRLRVAPQHRTLSITKASRVG